MGLTGNRLDHCLAVASKMKKIACENNAKYPVDSDAMFVLGLLHDIGYEYTDIQKKHAEIGGELLKKQGYQYWKEVFYHGIYQVEYDSPELRLLNYADMTTGPNGEDMTMDQRINDIESRYGSDSWQKKEAVKLMSLINRNM